jgi:S-adenosylmethionine:tRNA ribosyltransferase-isomerase
MEAIAAQKVMNKVTSTMTNIDSNLVLDDFIYDLPAELIAQQPLANKDESRLLVRHSDGSLEDRLFQDILHIIPKDSIIVVNNSKVIPSRLFGNLATGAKVEIFLLNPVQNDAGKNRWKAIGKPGKKIKKGITIRFQDNCTATIVDRETSAMEFYLDFNLEFELFYHWLDKHGFIPLPPYIQRKAPKPAMLSEDRDTYQTVYASAKGSVAAPTAGLHFTDSLVARLKERGISILTVTLHVGAGTFMPVKNQNLDLHKMHEEWYSISAATLETLKQAKKSGKKVIAVGTTTLRSLESFYLEHGCDENSFPSHNSWHKTTLFIKPQTRTSVYKPWMIDGIITNFHQPGSTLFMLVSALLSLNEARRVYQHAVEERYRFFSYGDACFFWLSQDCLRMPG